MICGRRELGWRDEAWWLDRGTIHTTIDVAHAVGRHTCILSGLCSDSSRIIPRGTIIFREGEASQGVFVLRAGRVVLSASTPKARLRMVRVARAGEILGLASLFTRGSYDLTAEVSRAAQFSFVSHEDACSRLAANPEALRAVLRTLSHDVISCHDLVRGARA